MLDFTEKKKKENGLRFDLVLFISVLVISGFGLLVIYSATKYSLPGGITDSAFYLKKQGFWVITGLVLFLLTQIFNYRKLKKYFWLAIIINIGLLVSVLIFGYEVHGSKSWIDLGFSSFQPSEVSKVLMVVTVAAAFSKLKGEKENRIGFKKVMLSAAIAFSCMGLVIMQNDFGTALIFYLVYMGMLFVSGANLLYFISFLGLSAGGIFLGLNLGIIKQYQLDRILVFLKPNIQEGGAGYNLYQSKLAIGSGELFGQGLFLGKQTNLNYVPEHQTDFIFSVVGEELGFAGGAFVILMLALIIWRCLVIARKATDGFGALIASGIAFILLSQMIINIGMTIGIMPIIGIPLPFLSYGGSGLVSLFIGIAIVENIYRNRELRKYHEIAYEEFD
ncbi:MAG: rod shape-determining protein RodA [Candidatus Humimicrobiaceae bacterium]